jgi:hypothetical protein
MGDIAKSRNQIIMLVKETSKGTLVFPSTGGSAVETIGAGNADINQNPNFNDSDEIRNTRDVLSRFSDARPAGTWTIPTYMRPSGTAGSIPQDDVLYECLFGTKTVNSGTSVVYTQALEKPSLSIWILKDHTLFFASGATVSSMKPNISNQGGVTQEWSGGFMSMGWVGTDALTAGASSSATSVVVSDSKRFVSGGRIYNYTKDDDNSGAGYEITGVNVTTETLTLSSGISEAWNSADVVKPFLPTRVSVGSPLESNLTTVDIGSDTGKSVQTIDFTLNDPASYIEDEISTQGYPTAYLEDVRDYSGEINLYLRKGDVKYFYDAYNDISTSVTINFGDTAGSQAALSLPYAAIEVPTLSTNAPAINVAIGVKALGSSGEDSASLTFT